jgi:hypothetical protein
VTSEVAKRVMNAVNTVCPGFETGTNKDSWFNTTVPHLAIFEERENNPRALYTLLRMFTLYG